MWNVWNCVKCLFQQWRDSEHLLWVWLVSNFSWSSSGCFSKPFIQPILQIRQSQLLSFVASWTLTDVKSKRGIRVTSPFFFIPMMNQQVSQVPRGTLLSVKLCSPHYQSYILWEPWKELQKAHQIMYYKNLFMLRNLMKRGMFCK